MRLQEKKEFLFMMQLEELEQQRFESNISIQPLKTHIVYENRTLQDPGLASSQYKILYT